MSSRSIPHWSPFSESNRMFARRPLEFRGQTLQVARRKCIGKRDFGDQHFPHRFIKHRHAKRARVIFL